jgi:hypothetical protein
MKPWIIFCEADADFRTAEQLIDELLRLHGSGWVRDLLQSAPTDVRAWYKSWLGSSWFDIHRIDKIAERLDVSRTYGHFDGERGAPGARMLETVFRIVRKLQANLPPDERIEAIIVMWDMDKQGKGRHVGLAQAMRGAAVPRGMKIVLACPNPIRETWILAGFDPCNDDEARALEAAHSALGSRPNEKPHELTAGDETALRHAKRVCQALGIDSWEREQECLRIPDEARRSLLARRGTGCGLEDYLGAVERELVPLVDPTVRIGRS